MSKAKYYSPRLDSDLIPILYRKRDELLRGISDF